MFVDVMEIKRREEEIRFKIKGKAFDKVSPKAY